MEIPGEGSLRSGADSVGAGSDALEVTLVRSTGSDGFSDRHAPIVQVESSHSSISGRMPGSPQARASIPIAASPSGSSGVTPPTRFNLNSASPAASRTPNTPLDLTPFGVPALEFRNGTPQQQQQQTPHQTPMQQLQQQQQTPPSGYVSIASTSTGAGPAPSGMQRMPEMGMEPMYGHGPAPINNNSNNNRHTSQPGATHFDMDDDERTEPSSTVTGNTGENANGFTRMDSDATSTFGRIIHNTRRRVSSGNGYDRNNSGSMDDDDFCDGALIYGYLQKLGRNGKWQTRWFETDGECLTYYKSNKRTKLLATLDLAKVGSIVVNHADPKGTSFTINISERPYELRADSKSACKDWVITLNRVKEARMQEGNVKLVSSNHQQRKQPQQMVDLLDQSNSSSGYAPRVVVVANRQRTHKLDDEGMNTWDNNNAWQEDPVNSGVEVDYNGTPTPFADKLNQSSVRLARWRKSNGSFNKVADKVLRWARSLRKFGCTDADKNVVLDYSSYPPMHHNTPKSVPAHHSASGLGPNVGFDNAVGHSAWIGKEKAASGSEAGPGVHSIAPGLMQPTATTNAHDNSGHELS